MRIPSPRIYLRPVRLTRSAILWTLLPIALWPLATHARSWLIETRCGSHPELCAPQLVFGLDRFALGMNSSAADRYSYYTQNLSGVLAVLVPLLLALYQFTKKRVSLRGGLLGAGADLVVWLQTIGWNGFINECFRLLVQRPRPFVYSDPANWGLDPANYTSFYSGHTSFSAASCTALFLALLGRNAPLPWLIAAGAGGNALILMTGVYRVLAGRHFMTDVIAGACAGAVMALVVGAWNRRPAADASPRV